MVMSRKRTSQSPAALQALQDSAAQNMEAELLEQARNPGRVLLDSRAEIQQLDGAIHSLETEVVAQKDQVRAAEEQVVAQANQVRAAEEQVRALTVELQGQTDPDERRTTGRRLAAKEEAILVKERAIAAKKQAIAAKEQAILVKERAIEAKETRKATLQGIVLTLGGFEPVLVWVAFQSSLPLSSNEAPAPVSKNQTTVGVTNTYTFGYMPKRVTAFNVEVFKALTAAYMPQDLEAKTMPISPNLKLLEWKSFLLADEEDTRANCRVVLATVLEMQKREEVKLKVEVPLASAGDKIGQLSASGPTNQSIGKVDIAVNKLIGQTIFGVGRKTLKMILAVEIKPARKYNTSAYEVRTGADHVSLATSNWCPHNVDQCPGNGTCGAENHPPMPKPRDEDEEDDEEDDGARGKGAAKAATPRGGKKAKNRAPPKSRWYSPIRQLYSYMCMNKLLVGIMATYNQWWFFARDCSGHLYISTAFEWGDDTEFTVPQALFLWTQLANDTDEHIKDALLGSLPGYKKCLSCQHDKKERWNYPVAFGSGPGPNGGEGASGASSSSSSSSAAAGGASANRGGRVVMSMGCFERIEMLGAWRTGGTWVTEVDGVRGVIKHADVSKEPHLEEELANEAAVYARLAHLQGDKIPRLLYSGPTLEGFIHVICTSHAGRSVANLERALSDGEAEQMMTCLRAVHAGGFLHGDVVLRNFCVDDNGKVMLLDLAQATPSHNANNWGAEEDFLRTLISDQQQQMFP